MREVAIGIAKDRFVEAVHAKMAEGKTDEEAWEAFANMDDEEFESRLRHNLRDRGYADPETGVVPAP